LESEDPNEILLTEEEYNQKWAAGELNNCTPAPFLKKENEEE
jgi:hypothetical protein